MAQNASHPNHPKFPYAGREDYGFTVYMQENDSHGAFGDVTVICSFGEWCDENADGFSSGQVEEIRCALMQYGSAIVEGFVGHAAKLNTEPPEPAPATPGV